MPEIFTIGHSDRTWEAFAALLHQNGIILLVDIRRFSGSRHAPQFNEEPMRKALATEGIGYLHLPALGGRRRPRPDSANIAWRHPSFRGYADYMETAEFQAGLDELKRLAGDQRVAIMCAETVWWRCHRSLVADALTAQGWQVWHILDAGDPRPHRYTAPARIVDGTLTYQADPSQGVENAEPGRHPDGILAELDGAGATTRRDEAGEEPYNGRNRRPETSGTRPDVPDAPHPSMP